LSTSRDAFVGVWADSQEFYACYGVTREENPCLSTHTLFSFVKSTAWGRREWPAGAIDELRGASLH
jgi:hypothetical protein